MMRIETTENLDAIQVRLSPDDLNDLIEALDESHSLHKMLVEVRTARKDLHKYNTYKAERHDLDRYLEEARLRVLDPTDDSDYADKLDDLRDYEGLLERSYDLDRQYEAAVHREQLRLQNIEQAKKALPLQAQG